MRSFSLDSNNLFLRYSSKHDNIQIYQLQNLNSFPLTSRDWKFVASLGPSEKYSSLKIFGTEITDVLLHNLQEDLCVSHLMINPEGFCYLDTTEIADPTFNVQYYRLNDLFSWSEYVDLPSEKKFNTSWNRYEIQTGETVVNYEHLDEELNKKIRLLKQLEDELETTRQQLKLKINELVDANDRIFQFETRLDDKDRKLEKLREKVCKLEEDLNDTNNKIFQYEMRLEDKDKKLEKLRKKVSKLEQLQDHNKQLQQDIQEVKRAATYEAESSSTSNSPSDMRQEMLIEWQRLTNVWNQNKEKITRFYVNLGFTTGTLVYPQFEGTLREFTPVDAFTYPHRSVDIQCKSGQFDKDNWWCIGSYEYNKRIDLVVYDGSFGSVETYGTTVYIPYRQKYFFSNVQCFIGFLRGLGFRFMYVSAIHGVD